MHQGVGAHVRAQRVSFRIVDRIEDAALCRDDPRSHMLYLRALLMPGTSVEEARKQVD